VDLPAIPPLQLPADAAVPAGNAGVLVGDVLTLLEFGVRLGPTLALPLAATHPPTALSWLLAPTITATWAEVALALAHVVLGLPAPGRRPPLLDGLFKSLGKAGTARTEDPGGVGRRPVILTWACGTHSGPGRDGAGATSAVSSSDHGSAP
jgi:hypothetical protein